MPDDERRGRRPARDDAAPVEPVPRPSRDELVERYGHRIYTMAYRLTGDPHDAADLAQDVLVRVLGSLDRYEPGSFEGWLYRITKNLFLDGARRRQRIRFEPLADEDWRAPASGDPGPEDVLEREVLDARLDAALAALPEDFRLAVVLCDVQGLSYEEIGAATGWPIGTVRSRIHRGRRQLRDRLAPADAERERGAGGAGPGGGGSGG